MANVERNPEDETVGQIENDLNLKVSETWACFHASYVVIQFRPRNAYGSRMN